MATKTRAGSAVAPAGKDEDVAPNNPLQSDFTVDDTSSMDEDERYLVRHTAG